MKTKYILHGGSAQHINEENDKFFKEILKETSDNLNILLVHFAGSPERAELNKQIDTEHFVRVKGGKKLHFEIAEEDTFLNQIKKADIVYFGGRTTVKLLETLKKYHNLEKYFLGKVIAGESAGSNFLCTYCYSKSGGGVVRCLGILPLKMIPHYEDKNKKYKKELENIGKDVEFLALSNYQFKVFTQ